ncbi:MAG TPA: ABC transporter substrate-binding protein [Solirubrobacteraceae bacterium]|nr:ABC transporter substrate-binding protein [Solirubrobacteraceae bacterium]
MLSIKTFTALLGTVVVAVVLAACGSSSSSSSNTTEQGLSTGAYKSPVTESLTGGKRGGTLVVLQETEFEHLDPGISYYNLDYPVVFAMQRPLYSYQPNQEAESTPDLASGPPEIASDGKTVTVHLKHGVRFSPPVSREVNSEDVAYGIERGANPNVANPYIQAYFAAVEGIPKATGGPVKGIETPNKETIVFHLTEPKAQIVADALVLPLSAPVPREYAEKYDKNKPSNYASYMVATGPYMIKNNSEGKVLGVGYFPGKSLTLVHNPNWSASTDYRPAYLNEIQYKIGGNITVIGHQTLQGTNIIAQERPSQPIVKEAAENYKEQLQISPSAGTHYISVNNKVGPFKNANLRRALWAALDREEMLKVRGGSLVTTLQTHFLYPGIPGFEQSGGLKGPAGVPYNEHPQGDMALAEKYIKEAGFPSGKYSGESITVVGARGAPAEQDAEIVNQTLNNLGFKTKLSLPESSIAYAKYCNVPKEEITVCPSVGWIADFGDPQTVLNITFNGKFIPPVGNVNWSQADNPQINEMMDKAENVVGNGARASAWAKVDEEIVKEALAIPFDYDKQANVEGKSVAGVGQLWNSGEWDLDFTSLK